MENHTGEMLFLSVFVHLIYNMYEQRGGYRLYFILVYLGMCVCAVRVCKRLDRGGKRAARTTIYALSVLPWGGR